MAKDWPEIILRLRLTFELLEKAGLAIKLSKCHFGVESFEFLGFVVG